MPDPGERLEGEGAKAYEAFVLYREMGAARSLARVAEKSGKADPSLIERWSRRYNWVQRTRAYDANLDALARQQHQAQVLKVREKTAAIGIGMLEVAGDEVTDMRERQQTDGPLHFEPRDTAMLAEKGAALARTALGVPDQVVRVQSDDQFHGDPIGRAILFDDQTREDALAFLESAAAAAERARRGDS